MKVLEAAEATSADARLPLIVDWNGTWPRIDASAWIAPGIAENSLFPPVVFETSAAPAPVQATEQPAAPVDTPRNDAPLKPVELAPPPSPEDASSPGLPPVQNPQSAGG